MKLADISEAMGLARAKDRVDEAIASIDLGYVQIMIGGQVQDEAMLAACKASMLSELRGRKAALRRQLEALGVVVD